MRVEVPIVGLIQKKNPKRIARKTIQFQPKKIHEKSGANVFVQSRNKRIFENDQEGDANSIFWRFLKKLWRDFGVEVQNGQIFNVTGIFLNFFKNLPHSGNELLL